MWGRPRRQGELWPRLRAGWVGDELEVRGDLGGLAEHDGRRAVLVVREADRVLDEVSPERATGDDEVHVDLREHLRLRSRALGGEPHFAAADVLAAFLEDDDHVVGRA